MAAAGGFGRAAVIGSAYLAAAGYEAALAEELARAGAAVAGWHGRLALSPDPPLASIWALDVWQAPVELEAASVKAAADALRGMQRNWALYAAVHHRRCALIEARLPPVRAKPIVFPTAPPVSHLGAWTLLESGRLLASPVKSSPYPNGALVFVEDRAGPPSRAYLKLWEALTRIGAWPGAGQVCLDLGASPGGWTWVAASLGAQVVAVDRAPLDPAVAAMPGVACVVGSAFGVEPYPVDWLFSDVIAYPGRLLGLVQRWVAAQAAGRIVCTVKLQGATDYAAVDGFAAIAGGRLMHLGQNKHELTFCWERAGGGEGGVSEGSTAFLQKSSKKLLVFGGGMGGRGAAGAPLWGVLRAAGGGADHSAFRGGVSGRAVYATPRYPGGIGSNRLAAVAARMQSETAAVWLLGHFVPAERPIAALAALAEREDERFVRLQPLVTGARPGDILHAEFGAFVAGHALEQAAAALAGLWAWGPQVADGQAGAGDVTGAAVVAAARELERAVHAGYGGLGHNNPPGDAGGERPPGGAAILQVTAAAKLAVLSEDYSGIKAAADALQPIIAAVGQYILARLNTMIDESSKTAGRLVVASGVYYVGGALGVWHTARVFDELLRQLLKILHG